MNAIHRSIRLCGALTVSAVLGVVAGCAQVPPSSGNARPGQPVARQPASSGCDTGTAAVVGALAGAFFGKGKGHLVGAAVGAGVGAIACTAYNYHARQVRDHAAVEADYRRERGSLPEMNTVSSYRSSLQPSETVRAGSPVALESNIVVVNGTHDQAPKLAETLTLYSPDGKPLSTVTKQATDIGGTGEYQTNFSFNLPKGIQGGRYTVRSSLSMNDKVVKTNDMPMLVVG
ncbi:hypothetical protein L2Y94_00855 [Luteibacter aegosomatis]|uniref:hypothetical protein n=1 Tax=Luteibacter aegosomatis TaxID=2911537 RepID=UPI001FFC0912|nr:hypothetical protein [Luteibacter aegosomatis]UPG85945.1 hypothetical protein L2Y94_00855 [Luteibacter aegosomatis]